MKYLLFTFLLFGCATTQCNNPDHKDTPNSGTKCDEDGCKAQLFHFER